MSEKNSQLDHRLSQQNAKDAITKLKDYFLGNNAENFFSNGTNFTIDGDVRGLELDILTGLLDTTNGAYFLKDIVDLEEVFDNPSEVSNSNAFKVLYETNFADLSAEALLNFSNPSYLYPVSVSSIMTQIGAKYSSIVQQKTDSNGNLIDVVDENGIPVLVPGAVPTDEIKENIVNIDGGKNPNRFSTPSLGAVEIKNMRFSIGNRNNDLINLFFNAIPGLEMSRATPFIQFKLITADNPFTKNTLNNTYFFRFLKEENGEFVFDDNAGLTKGTSYNDKPSQGLNNSISISNIGKNFNTSGMDLFTSPQTLVNANIRNTDSSLFNEDILDPFQPLMTLKSLKFDNSGLGGTLYTSKSATAEIILHDRSRLKDIQPLISARDFGLNQVLIEFGWSHPDGGAQSNNDFARIINSLRDVGLYNVQQSSFSIGASGEVNISMTLRCTGLQEFKNVSCAAGYYTPLAVIKPQITQVVESYINRKIQNSEDKHLPEIRKKADILRNTAYSSSAMISFFEFSDLMKTAGFGLGSNDEEIVDDEFISKLKNLLGIIEEDDLSFQDNANLRINEVSNNKTAVESIMSKVYSLTGTEVSEVLDENGGTNNDPFLNSRALDYNKSSGNYSESEYVSLGKIILSFVGLSFAGTGRFDEVQVFFYPLNSKSGGARQFTTAGFPIKKSTFREIVEKKIQTAPNLSVRGLVSLINKEIINKDDYIVYGFSDTVNAQKSLKEDFSKQIAELRKKYEPKSSDSEARVKQKAEQFEAAKEELIKDSETIQDANDNAISESLKNIYSTDGGPSVEPVFKNPVLKYYIENLPVLSPGTDQPQFGKKSICRIHMYDKESIVSASAERLNDLIQSYAISNSVIGSGANENQEEIEELTVQQNLGKNSVLKLKQGIGAREIKQKIKKTMANITLGTSNGVVKSVSVNAQPGGNVGNVLLLGSISDKVNSKTNQANISYKEDVQVIPGQVSLTCLGNPCIQHANEIYIDFNSGTSLDNIYIVKNVSHTIGQGDFTTTLSLSYTGQGETSAIKKKIEDAIAAKDIAEI